MKDLEDETIRMQTEAASYRARMTKEFVFLHKKTYINQQQFQRQQCQMLLVVI